jgi:hypothetical protein
VLLDLYMLCYVFLIFCQEEDRLGWGIWSLTVFILTGRGQFGERDLINHCFYFDRKRTVWREGSDQTSQGLHTVCWPSSRPFPQTKGPFCILQSGINNVSEM